MNGEQMGKALAAAIGDLRDWPPECIRCRSRNIKPELTPQDTYKCGDCGLRVTGEVVATDRCERAQRETGVRP